MKLSKNVKRNIFFPHFCLVEPQRTLSKYFYDFSDCLYGAFHLPFLRFTLHMADKQDSFLHNPLPISIISKDHLDMARHQIWLTQLINRLLHLHRHPWLPFSPLQWSCNDTKIHQQTFPLSMLRFVKKKLLIKF